MATPPTPSGIFDDSAVVILVPAQMKCVAQLYVCRSSNTDLDVDSLQILILHLGLGISILCTVRERTGVLLLNRCLLFAIFYLPVYQ